MKICRIILQTLHNLLSWQVLEFESKLVKLGNRLVTVFSMMTFNVFDSACNVIYLFVCLFVYFSGTVHNNQQLDCRLANSSLRGQFSSVVPGQIFKRQPKITELDACRDTTYLIQEIPKYIKRTDLQTKASWLNKIFQAGTTQSPWVEPLVVQLVFDLWVMNF